MRAVNGRQDMFAAGESADFFGGQDDSGDGRDVDEENYARARSDGIAEKIENLGRVLNRFGGCVFLDYDAVALGPQIPGMLAAGMFLIGEQDLISRFKVDAVGDVAISFRGITQDGDLIAVAAYEGGQRITEFIPGGVAPDRVVFRIGLVHLFGGFVAFEDGAQNRGGAGAYRAIIEINFVGGDQELFAQFTPVVVFVLVIERAVRELLGQGFELRPEVASPAESGGGGEGRRQKIAAGQHRGLSDMISKRVALETGALKRRNGNTGSAKFEVRLLSLRTRETAACEV